MGQKMTNSFRQQIFQTNAGWVRRGLAKPQGDGAIVSWFQALSPKPGSAPCPPLNCVPIPSFLAEGALYFCLCIWFWALQILSILTQSLVPIYSHSILVTTPTLLPQGYKSLLPRARQNHQPPSPPRSGHLAVTPSPLGGSLPGVWGCLCPHHPPCFLLSLSGLTPMLLQRGSLPSARGNPTTLASFAELTLCSNHQPPGLRAPTSPRPAAVVRVLTTLHPECQHHSLCTPWHQSLSLQASMLP